MNFKVSDFVSIVSCFDFVECSGLLAIATELKLRVFPKNFYELLMGNVCFWIPTFENFIKFVFFWVIGFIEFVVMLLKILVFWIFEVLFKFGGFFVGK